MTDLFAHRVLTAAEERALLERYTALRAEHGAHSRPALRARNELVTCNMRLVHRIAKRIPGLDLEDRIGYGVEGLIVAIERFDVSRGHRLSTFALPWIRFHIRRATENTERVVRIPVGRQEKTQRDVKAGRESRDGVTLELGGFSLDVPTHAEGETWHGVVADARVVPADELLEAKQEAEIAEQVLGELEPAQRVVVEARYGLTEEEQTLAAIGARIDRSRERVRQIENEAIAQMRELVA